MGKESDARKRTADAMEAYLQQTRRGERIEAGSRRWLGRLACMAIGISLYQLAEGFEWFSLSC
jgi:hypothetical protein